MIQTISDSLTLRYEPRGAAKQLWSCKAEEVLLPGPAGTGKTLGCLQKLNALAVKYAGMRGLMVRKTLVSLTSAGLVTWREKVRPDIHGAHFFGGNSEKPAAYIYPNGSEIVVGGLDKPQKVMSTEYDVAYFQEATEATEVDWESVSARLRWGVLPYQQLMGDCNPDAPTHWILQRANRGALTLLESKYEDNPLYWDLRANDWTEEGRRYVIGRLDKLTGVRYQRLRLGKWAAAEGQVYETWDRAVHLLSEIQLRERGIITDSGLNRAKVRSVDAGVDWGFTNPGVIQVYAEDNDGRLYLIHELYQTKRTIDWWITQGKALRDTYGIGTFVCDPSEPAYIEQFNDAGLHAVKAVNDIAPGIQAVQQRLAPAGDGQPRFFVFDAALDGRDAEREEHKLPCGLVDEIQGYTWDRAGGKARGEEPKKEHDHAADATRYLVMFKDRRRGSEMVLP